MLKSIRLKNFQCHKDTYIEFHSCVSAIIGTSDSGKTAILRALAWVERNRPSGMGVIRHGTKEASVVIEIEKQGKVLTVTKTRSTTKNEYTCGEAEFATVGREVPEEVIQAFGFQDINTQQQLDQPFLVFETPGQIAATFNRFTKLDIAESLAYSIALDIKRSQRVLSEQLERLEELKDRVKKYDWLNAFERDVGCFERVVDETNKAASQKRTIDDTIKEMEEITFQLDEFDITIGHKESIFKIASIALLEIAKREQESEEKSNSVETLFNIISSLRREQRRIAENKKRLPVLRKGIGSLNKLVEKTEILDNELTIHIGLISIVSKIDVEENRCVVYKKSLEDKQQELKETMKKMSELDVCPYCGSKLTVKTRKLLLESIEK